MSDKLREEVEIVVRLRVERDDLTARIAALESDLNHRVGINALAAKMYNELIRVKTSK